MQTARGEGETSSALFWKLKGVTLFVGEIGQITASVGKFPIKNAFLGVPREKTSTFSP